MLSFRQREAWTESTEITRVARSNALIEAWNVIDRKSGNGHPSHKSGNGHPSNRASIERGREKERAGG